MTRPRTPGELGVPVEPLAELDEGLVERDRVAGEMVVGRGIESACLERYRLQPA